MAEGHKPHFLRVQLGRDHFGLDIDCPGPGPGWCQVYEEGNWADAKTCRCTQEGNDCEDCAEADHACCGFYGGYIEEVGDECRCVPVDGCGVKEHGLDFLTWNELLHGPDTWTITEYPVPVNVHWNSGSIIIEPWAVSDA
jgi:hypothetical protein